MISMYLRAAFAAVFLVAGTAVNAQTAGGPVTQDPGGDYKPPARMIAKPSAAAQPGQLGQPAPQVAPSALKTIGLISAIGETYTVKRVGMTVFGNELENYPIPAWKVNDRIAATVGNLLKKNFRIKRIPATEKDFAAIPEPGLLFRDQDEEFAAVARRLAAAHPADFYLVITRNGSQFGSSNQAIFGLGVLRTNSIVGGGDYYHALTVLRVYDAQFQRLRWDAPSIGQDDGFLAVVKGPHVLVTDDDKLLPENPQAALNDPRTRQTTLDLLDKSLSRSVPKLFAQD